MNRLRCEERGGVLVVSAFLIPVLLLLTALVIDVGNWFTHNRQLQNRADAAAYAAGLEYANNWKGCISSDPLVRQATANAIADVARQYAGNPEASDYSTGTLPALQNTEIANQANLDVVINSSDADYTDDTDNTDAGVGVVADACYDHLPNTDTISPGGGQWTDVRVKEHNLPSLFGAVGLPLNRAGARARVEIRPALSGHRFLPLAVPNNVIEKVQLRYYNECTGAQIGPEHNLYELPADQQTGFVTQGGGTLWALEGAPGVGDKNVALNLSLPQYDGSCGDYVPVGVEVRLASRAEVDLNQTCAQLAAARYADCFRRLSQIRVWNDGNATSQPRLTNVNVTDGCGAPADAYFSRLPVASTNCSFTVSAEVDWGTRDDDQLNIIPNFKVSANGVQLNPPSGSPSGIWTSDPNAVSYGPGANTVTISLNWEDNGDTGNSWNGACTNGNNNPCKYSGSQPAHQAFVGTRGNSGAVVLVNNSATQVTGGLPGYPFDNHRSGGGPNDCNDSDVCTIYPTVGTESVLKAGVLTTLRLDDPQANQTLQCDPNYAQGQEFSAFQYGCGPWYTANKWSSPWWVNKQCPDPGQWFSYATMPTFGKNGPSNAWQCVLTAPGMSVGQIGDDIAVATENCDTINSNSCQQFDCNYGGNYDGKDGVPGWDTTGGKNDVVEGNPVKLGSKYPRVVNLFIVPYQGGKGLTGAGDTIPVLGFASFYVMNWTGANNNQSDPCPDKTWGNVTVPDPPAGAITGVFVETVDYESGPVDKNATCYEGMLGQCRATLVR